MSQISQSDFFSPKVLVLISLKYDFAYDLPLFVIHNNEINRFLLRFSGNHVYTLRTFFKMTVYKGCIRMYPPVG